MAILVICGDKMANLGPIDFKIGLHIKVNVNDRQIKFEVHISEHLAKMGRITRMDPKSPSNSKSFFSKVIGLNHPPPSLIQVLKDFQLK